MAPSLFFFLLPSEVCRLVLGYIQDLGCTETYGTFLRECNHLSELRSILHNTPNASLSPRVAGFTLDDILRDYFDIINTVNDKRDSSMVGYGPSDLPFCRPGDAVTLLKHFLYESKKKPCVKHASTLCNLTNFTTSSVPTITHNRIISIPRTVNPGHITVIRTRNYPQSIPISLEVLTTVPPVNTPQTANIANSSINSLQPVTPQLAITAPRTPESNASIPVTTSPIDTTPTSVNNSSSSSSRRKPNRVRRTSGHASSASNTSPTKDLSLDFERVLCSVAANAETLANKINSNLAEVDIPGEMSNFMLHYNGLSESDFDEIYRKLVEDYNDGTDIDLDKILASDDAAASSNQDFESPFPPESCSSVTPPVAMVTSNTASGGVDDNKQSKEHSTKLETSGRKPRSARKSIPRKLDLTVQEKFEDIIPDFPASSEASAEQLEPTPSTSAGVPSGRITQDYPLNLPAVTQLVDLDQTPLKKLPEIHTLVTPEAEPSTSNPPRSGPLITQSSRRRNIPWKPLSVSRLELTTSEESSTSPPSAVADSSSVAIAEPNATSTAMSRWTRRRSRSGLERRRPACKRFGYCSEYVPNEAYPVISTQPHTADGSMLEFEDIAAPKSVCVSATESDAMIVDPTKETGQVMPESDAVGSGPSTTALSSRVTASSTEQSQANITAKSSTPSVEYTEYSIPVRAVYHPSPDSGGGSEESAESVPMVHYEIPASAQAPRAVAQTRSAFKTTEASMSIPYQIIDLSDPKVTIAGCNMTQQSSGNLGKSRLLGHIRSLQPGSRERSSLQSPQLKRPQSKARKTSRNTPPAAETVGQTFVAQPSSSSTESYPALQPHLSTLQLSTVATQQFLQPLDAQQLTDRITLGQPRLIIRIPKEKMESLAAQSLPSQKPFLALKNLPRSWLCPTIPQESPGMVREQQPFPCSSTPTTSMSVKENVSPECSAPSAASESASSRKKRKIDFSKMDIEAILEKVHKKPGRKPDAEN
ncbi:hypothetical protein Aperf_G00000123353 [Anoplocephala perfoliata]